jgi:hypothetical protein
MSSELSGKNKVLVTKLGDFWVNDVAAEKIRQSLDDESVKGIDLDDNFIRISSVDGIICAEAYGDMQIKKRGGWQCKYQKWHERNTQCAHAQLLN